jgi:hypothetical protein
MPKMDNEAKVSRLEREASRTYGGDQEQIATALFKASEEARQQGNEPLAQALLERAVTLALPFIPASAMSRLISDEHGESRQGKSTSVPQCPPQGGKTPAFHVGIAVKSANQTENSPNGGTPGGREGPQECTNRRR